MEWPKLKNIILLILVITNLFLLVFVLRREMGLYHAQKEARSNAVAFLAARGVEVDEEIIPRTGHLAPQTVERDLTAEGAAAAELLGGSVSVEPRGGEVYRYYNENGAVQFHNDGSFSAEFAAGAFPLGETREAVCEEALAALGFQGELLEETQETLVYRQTWNGVALFNQQVTLEYNDGCLTAMTGGRRLMGEPVPVTGETTFSEGCALIVFLNELDALGDICSRLDGITPGYVSVMSLNKVMTLTPVWRIATDTGTYQLNLVSGGLERLG